MTPATEAALRAEATHHANGTKPALEVLPIVHHKLCNKKPLSPGHIRILTKCLLLGHYAIAMDDMEFGNKDETRRLLTLLVARGLVENSGRCSFKHSPKGHTSPVFEITQKGIDSI